MSKVKLKPPPKKIEEHLFQTTIDMHIRNPYKNSGRFLNCLLHWLLQCALYCYQTAKARILCVYILVNSMAMNAYENSSLE